MRVKQKGMTLIELMVVVAVLAIIAGIAYPVYVDQIHKTRRADAKITLETIAHDQERFYTIMGSYAPDFRELYQLRGETNELLVLPCDPVDNCITSSGNYRVELLQDTDQDFLIRATTDPGGAQADDTDCPVLSLDQQGEKLPAVDCW